MSEAISPCKRAGLALEQADHLVEAGDHLGVHRAAAPLLVDREVVGDLPQPRHQGLEPLLGGLGGLVGLRPLAIAKRAMTPASSRSVFSRTPIASA